MSQTPQPQNNPQADWPAQWFEKVEACPLCASCDLAPFLASVRDWYFRSVPGEFAFARCQACASLVLTSRPDAEHIGAAYAAYYTHDAAAKPAAASNLIQRIGRSLATAHVRARYDRSPKLADSARAAIFALFPVRRAEIDAEHRHLPRDHANVLDYGCGNGDFLARAKAHGHEVYGVDFDAEALATARQSGLTVCLPDEIDETAFAARFDHITLAHVLEHVADPVALLTDCRRWLRPGGTIFIEVPNAQASGLARFGRFWRGLEAPRHFSVPSIEGLRIALEKAGFSIENFGARNFAHVHMDAIAAEMMASHGQEPDHGAGLADASGPEFLTCLARAQ